jgi:hypothetical protein
VTKSLEPIRALILPLGAKIIFGRQMSLLELGEALLMKRQANKKERLALMRMGISEEETSEEGEELIERRIDSFSIGRRRTHPP